MDVASMTSAQVVLKFKWVNLPVHTVVVREEKISYRDEHQGCKLFFFDYKIEWFDIRVYENCLLESDSSGH